MERRGDLTVERLANDQEVADSKFIAAEINVCRALALSAVYSVDSVKYVERMSMAGFLQARSEGFAGRGPGSRSQHQK